MTETNTESFVVTRTARTWNGDGFDGPYETTIVARYASRAEAEEVAHGRSMSDGSVATYGVEEEEPEPEYPSRNFPHSNGDPY